MTESLILTLLILTVEFSDVRASPLNSDPHITSPVGRSQMSEPFKIKQPSNQMKESSGRQITRVKTVAVICHENYMEIAIKADLFEVGLPVDASELQLGADSQFITSCKVSAFSTNEYIIAARLTDCGTQHWITDDSLIYTNLLIFTPQPSPDGVVRLEQAVVPIECYYRRRFDITSNPIRPTWVPFSSTQSAVEDLQLSLKLMTSDWRSERASSMYFLGDFINIEASVRLGHHVNLRVYIESCVATVTPDIKSLPKYTFIENHGCLTDGRTTGSKSRFLPRIQNDKLQLQLDAFKFHQETRPEMYITCTLQAYPVMDVVDPFHKACSFIDGSWKAADGGDWACYSCQATKDYAFLHSTPQQPEPPSPRRDQTSSSQRPNKFKIQEGSGSSFKSLPTSEPVLSWKNVILPQEEDYGVFSVGWEEEKTIGPLAILPKKMKMGFLAPPRVKQGVPPVPYLSKDKKPMPHSSLWKNGVSAKMDKSVIIPQPSLEDTEQANIMAIKPESKKMEDEYDSEDGDDTEDYDGRGEDHDYKAEKEKTREVYQNMWKTKLLPEEDFKERFTTLASNSEEDSGLHTLGTSPSLPDKEEGSL